MSVILDEMKAILNGEMMHYGVARRSGRYPWGSGDNPYQRSIDLLGRIELLKKQGLSENEIAKELGMVNKKGEPSSTQLRKEIAFANYERRLLLVETAKSLKEDGLGPTEIGRKMDLPESTVRSLLNPKSEDRMNAARNTADFIKAKVDKDGMVDVTTGVETELRISKERMELALFMLEKEGYPVYLGGIPQINNPGQQTNQKVICKPGTQHKEIYEFDKVHALNEDNYVSHDGGDTFDKMVYPKSMDSKRLMIRYKEDGGIDKDGIVELRRGVEDLSLGEARYSQVRILVDNDHYIKGMAVYSDAKDWPDGVDVVFNTNKTKDKSKMEVLKEIKHDDPMNPFGSTIKANGQSYYYDKDGKKQLSLINKRADEGDWDEWKDALPSQFLGKQSVSMIKKQLNLAKADKMAEYEDICSLNNPTVKKHLLNKFADGCDSAAVHLQAAALPGQKYHVIIPVNTLKDTEVYAPNYENGTKLALVRYPHGGLFEIPILTVNNKHKAAKDLLGTDIVDAVGINAKVAERLSGADFDGDTVMCIPTHDAGGKVKIASKPPLKGLEGFDPKTAYPETEGMKYMGKKLTQTEMGKISNLITDMTLGGATDDELARAVRHSMVVIDANKHKLNYKKSEIDNDIASLKKKYQVKVNEDGTETYGGAATILSRAKGETTVNKRQGTPKVNIKGTEHYDPTKPEGSLIYKEADPETLYKVKRTKNKATGEVTLTTIDGKKIKYDPSDKEASDEYRPIKNVDKETGTVTYTNKKGTITYDTEKRTQPSTRMAETDDAYSLVSEKKWQKELIYADYANSMKAMANQARLDQYHAGSIKVNKAAQETYKEEVASLNKKLNEAMMNKPRERAAQRAANAQVKAMKEANPNMSSEDIKKAGQRALNTARSDYGSIKRSERNINITDREWEAIQAGAISETKLVKILDNTDVDRLRQLATPKTTTTLSTAQINRAKQLANSNYTLDEIAKKMGKSTSTISKYLKGVE